VVGLKISSELFRVVCRLSEFRPANFVRNEKELVLKKIIFRLVFAIFALGVLNSKTFAQGGPIPLFECYTTRNSYACFLCGEFPPFVDPCGADSCSNEMLVNAPGTECRITDTQAGWQNCHFTGECSECRMEVNECQDEVCVPLYEDIVVLVQKYDAYGPACPDGGVEEDP
jgi:hypothetical protein